MTETKIIPTHELPCDRSTKIVGEFGRTPDGQVVGTRTALCEWTVYRTGRQFFVTFFQGVYALRGLSEGFNDLGHANQTAKQFLDRVQPL